MKLIVRYVLRIGSRCAHGDESATMRAMKPIVISNQVWCSPQGERIACVEKLKVLRENLEEIHQVCQDALEDAVLMGCDEQQFRDALAELVAKLENPYRSH